MIENRIYDNSIKHRLSNLVKVPVIHIGNHPLKRDYSSNSLGVYIDDKLSWANHIDHVSKKISSAIGGLRRVRPYVPLKTVKTIYNALILPHFDYCDVVWGNINKGLADRIQKLQNRAARVITSFNYDIRSVDILKRLNWDNLSIRRYKHKAITMFKIMHGKSPKYLQGQFEKDTVGNLYSLRRCLHGRRVTLLEGAPS